MVEHETETVIDDDLEELEFSPLTPDESAALDDRVYLVGVHADRARIL
jgi:hypothetical protein